MKFDFINFQKKLQTEVLSIYKKLSETEEIDFLSLYTDAGAMSVCMSANTSQFLEEKIEDEPNNYCYYTWVPDAWKYDYIESDVFDELSNLLSDYVLNNDFESEAFFNTLASCFIDAFRYLEQFDTSIENKVIRLFTVSDCDNNNEKIKWFEELNRKYIVNKYKKCLSTPKL